MAVDHDAGNSSPFAVALSEASHRITQELVDAALSLKVETGGLSPADVTLLLTALVSGQIVITTVTPPYYSEAIERISQTIREVAFLNVEDETDFNPSSTP